jgi:hypothetical protein
MIATWYGIVSFMLIVYIVLDGRNFGAGMLHWLVAKTPEERRQVVARSLVGRLRGHPDGHLSPSFGGIVCRILSCPYADLVVPAFTRDGPRGRRPYQRPSLAAILGFCFRCLKFPVGSSIRSGCWKRRARCSD